MFKGIKSFINHKTKEKSGGSQTKLMPVVTADKIISDKKRADIISRLPVHLGLSDEKYRHLVMTLIRRFAEFTQLLPETRNSYFAHNGGLFDHGLERADAALSLVRGYFLPDEGEGDELTEPQTLWTYAVFSAALLNGVGKVKTDFIVELFDHQEKFIRTWLPISGSMLTQGAFYDYEFDNVQPDSFKRRSSVVIATQLMPEEGFLWLSTDKDVFAMWLALLEDDQRDAGTLGPILWRADAQVINNNLNQQKMPREFGARERAGSSPFGLPYTIGQSTIGEKAQAGDMNQAGIEFLRWLHSGLLTQKLRVNQSAMFVVPAGMVLCADMFKLFVREHPEFKNWAAVQNSLVEMGLIQAGMYGESVQQFTRTSEGQSYQGVVLANIHTVLPEQFQVVIPGEIQPVVYSPEQLALNTGLQGDFVYQPPPQSAPVKKFIGPNGKLVTGTGAPPKVQPIPKGPFGG